VSVEAAALDLIESAVVLDPAPARLFKASQLSWYAARIDRVRERLDVEYGAEHSLRELARDVGMSPFHFARVFRELTGTPPHRYLVERRVAVAERMLLGGASAGDAALATGFVSPSHFTRTFTRLRGRTPSACRRGGQGRATNPPNGDPAARDVTRQRRAP
jgi:AraC-like DNA-binding protein